ncbi:MAG: hypothetical protein R2764_21155 [Bacteroidales bacterium]
MLPYSNITLLLLEGGLTNPYSQARISYYGISGIPNSFFDGITNVLGGSTGTYNQFLAKYKQRRQ